MLIPELEISEEFQRWRTSRVRVVGSDILICAQAPQMYFGTASHWPLASQNSETNERSGVHFAMSFQGKSLKLSLRGALEDCLKDKLHHIILSKISCSLGGGAEQRSSSLLVKLS